MSTGLSPISMICVTGQFMDSRIVRDSAVWLMPVTINPAGFCARNRRSTFSSCRML